MINFGRCRMGLRLYALLLGMDAAMAAMPVLKWTVQGQANLYGPPLVADMNSAPGLETVICDAEMRCMVCVDAQGKELWRYKGGWKKRLISTPALSGPGPDGLRLLLVGNPDKMWACVDAATGKERWKRELGAVEWGGGLWADVDGDGVQEAVLGTFESGVALIDRDGNERWRYMAPAGDQKLELTGPMAVQDVNGDRNLELLGASRFGPFCLSATGKLLWSTITWDTYESGVVVGSDPQTAGKSLLFTVSRDDNMLWCFEAATGTVRWKKALMGAIGIYTGSSIALGDLDASPYQYGGDAVGDLEVVVGTQSGQVQVFGFDGHPRWVYQTEKPTHVTPSLGDVDGDGWVEVLVSCGDHQLYALTHEGALKWIFATELRLVYPPSLADVDGDGATEILVCGSDSRLRCLGLGGAYRPELMPWPMRQHDVALSGAWTPPGAAGQTGLITETQDLLPQGNFSNIKVADGLGVATKDSQAYKQRANQPRGWYIEANAVAGKPVPMSGMERVTMPGTLTMALHITQPMIVVSDPVAMSPGRHTLTVQVSARGVGTQHVVLRQLAESVWTEKPIALQNGATAKKKTFRGQIVLERAEYVQLALVQESVEGWWLSASLQQQVSRPEKVEVLVNQVGYDVSADKRFVVQTDATAERGRFLVWRGTEKALEGTLQATGRIKGFYGQDWGYNYWQGDFSTLTIPGDYVIQVVLEKSGNFLAGEKTATARSYAFRVDSELLWNATAEPAYRFFYYQRCGMAIPGLHELCHLDDSIGSDGKQYDLQGGWHDAGDYNKYHNAPYVMGLARAYERQKTLFASWDRDGNGQADFLDEVLWGAEHVRRMMCADGSVYGGITSGYGFWAAPELETDNIPGTGDERPIIGALTGNPPGTHHAALAKVATFAANNTAWVEAAERGLRWSLDHQQRGLEQFSTALDLYAATQQTQYVLLAKELFPAIQASAPLVDAVSRYDMLFKEDHSTELREALKVRAEQLLTAAQNPFGVYTFGAPEHPNFFHTPVDQSGWHVGTSSQLLEAAELAALAYRYTNDERYREFAYNQFHWTLGMNPFNVSLMEGCGKAFLPTYHNRIAFGGRKRGAIPGSVVNGVTWRAVGDDSPFVDMSGIDIPAYEPNEAWLPHNTNYLNALTALHK